MSRNKKIFISSCIVVALFVCLCVAMSTCILIYQGSQAEQVKARIDSNAGVLTNENIAKIDNIKLSEEKYKNVKILYSEAAIKEKNYLKFLLESKGINDRLADDKKEIVIVITDKLVDKDLKPRGSETTKSITRDIFTYSGNYIYITKNDFEAFEDIHRVYRNLYGGILNAELFYGIPASDIKSADDSGKVYDMLKSPSVQKYVEISGAIREGDRWTFKTIDQKVAYSGSKFCSDIVEVEELLLCTSIADQMESSSSIPSEVKNFLKTDLAVIENVEYTSLNLADPGYADRLLTQYKLAKTPFQYLGGSDSIFSDALMEKTSYSSEYYKVKSAKIEEIKKSLQAQGWTFIKQTTPIRDSDYGQKDSRFMFEKKNEYVNQELVIVASDTSTLTSDCVSSAASKSKYCDSKSIYKNSGYVIQLYIGENTNYMLD